MKIYSVILNIKAVQFLIFTQMIHAPTTIYSASAGSGKTYTLARDYLTLLFKHPFHDGYRYILAVTFTNKAVAEMKDRIMHYLYVFTQETIDPKALGIYKHIQQETGLDNDNMRLKATAVHNKLLHDYAAFDIVTIDAFSHRILRTFSKDLNLPDGFEVSLDSVGLVDKAIYRLLARSGHEQELTKTLVSFSLEKIDDGRSWDIEHDLREIAQLLLNENHFRYLQAFKDKDAGDFLRFRESIKKTIHTATSSLMQEATDLIASCAQNDVYPQDFKGGVNASFNAIVKIANGEMRLDKVGNGIKALLAGNFYAKALVQVKKDAIDGLQPSIMDFCERFNAAIGEILFHKNIFKSLVPLSLLNELSHELDHIKKEERIVPIFEFNGLLQNQIKDEPAPFIYERLGERYRHYFIDEFQDTSTMQWGNLVPLIDNAVVQERLDGTRGSLMLVGDAKQSIYRWRGGDVDQFLGILGSDTLFGLPINKEPLPKNYRSTDEVVTFNNEFFALYGTALNGAVYKNLYEQYLKQEINNVEHGYVQIDFLEPEQGKLSSSYGADEQEDNDETITIYPPHVLRQVHSILKQGYNEGDICVLVRAHKQGNEIAKYLIKNNVAVVSGESLQVAISPRVQLLEHFMLMNLKPDQEEPRYRFLMAYLQLHPQDGIQQFVESHIKSDIGALFTNLFGEQAAQGALAFEQHSLFEATEIVANVMGLFETMDTRLQTFMEFVYGFANGFEVSLHSFVEHWETKKSKLSVPAIANPRAVQIMTIHKAKGLEFPIVIAPYCDMKLDESRTPTTWIPVDPEYYDGFEYVYMSLKTENAHYNAMGANTCGIAGVYEQHIAKTQMDQINTLYVAFTRAAEQLYIMCKQKKGSVSSQTYGTLLEQFVDNKGIILQEGQGYKMASFGTLHKKEPEKNESREQITVLDSYKICVDTQRVSVSTRKGLLWASGADLAIHKGNLLHDYLAQMQYDTNLPDVVRAIEQDRTLQPIEKTELIATLSALVLPENFGRYFSAALTAINEQPILMPDGKKLIPDRLLLSGNEATIIDYKTGAELPKHKLQLDAYAKALQEMGYDVVKKVLLYTDKMNEVTWL